MSRALAAEGLDQLTEREKRVLYRLARGHSVKSAAVDEGITEYAANELLRSARRKLGTGSSREAARLLAAHELETQKFRDEKSGIPLSRPDRPTPERLSKGVIVMSLTALAASAIFVLALQGRTTGPSPDAASPQPPSPAPATVPAPPAAGPVDRAAAAPRVVATEPAQGAVIEPGPFRMAVTFDRPMAPDSYAFSRSDEGAHPECTGKPRLSPDGRSYAFDCVAQAGARYVVHLNRPPYIGFLDAETGVPAQEGRLEFSVAGDAPATDSAVAPPPRVVRTSPAEGGAIAAGPFTVSVTFDRPMLADNFSFVRSDEGAYPECSRAPRQSPDGRTFSLECVAPEPGTYVMYFNRPPYTAFRDAATRTPARSMRLQFTVRAP